RWVSLQLLLWKREEHSRFLHCGTEEVYRTYRIHELNVAGSVFGWLRKFAGTHHVKPDREFEHQFSYSLFPYFLHKLIYGKRRKLAADRLWAFFPISSLSDLCKVVHCLLGHTFGLCNRLGSDQQHVSIGRDWNVAAGLSRTEDRRLVHPHIRGLIERDCLSIDDNGRVEILLLLRSQVVFRIVRIQKVSGRTIRIIGNRIGDQRSHAHWEAECRIAIVSDRSVKLIEVN